MQLSFYKLFNLSIIHLLLFTNILAIDRSIGVLNIIDKNEDELNTIDYKGEPYVSVKEFSRMLSDREPYENVARKKIVLYFSDNRIKISNLSSFIIVNDEVFQFSVGLNGVGTKAVNALSENFEVISYREKKNALGML